MRELARASASDIAKVAGMSQQTAELVYSALHTDREIFVNLPNFLTLLRVVLIPVLCLPGLFHHSMQARFQHLCF